MITRRSFLGKLFGAAATVAIGMRMAQGEPKLTQPTFDLVPDQAYRMQVKINYDSKLGFQWADWRGVYGSPTSG